MSRLTELINHYQQSVDYLAKNWNVTTRHMEMGEIRQHREHCQIEDDTLVFLKELQHYKDLEEQLEKLYGDRLSLDNVVDNLNRIIQNGEENLDYARILTNTEAEKWDKWKDLEEQGRLKELPCKVGDTVYFPTQDRHDEAVIESISIGKDTVLVRWVQYEVGVDIIELWDDDFFEISEIGKTVFLTKEEAEKALAELKGTEE